MYVSKEFIYGLLRECIRMKDLKGGRRVQCIIITNEFCQINILSNNLIRLFAACGCLLEANLVFCSIPQPSVLSWEAIISAYASSGRHDVALTLYHTMNVEGIEVNRCIFLSILKCSTSDGYGVKRGMIIHNEVVRNGFDSDKAVVNSLIDMYAKSGNLDEAQKVFDKTVNRDIVSFSAMITGYALHGYGSLALNLFEKLHKQDEKLDKVTFLTTLKACGNEVSVRQGRLIHGELIESGFESDMSIGSAVIDMYAKCGSLEEAQRTFDILQNRNIISWGALISGYAQHGYGNAVLQLYNEMVMSNIVPDKVIFVCALKACGIIQSIVHGRYIHNQIIRMGHMSDPIVSSALIDMYGNCGSLNEAQKVFDSLPVQDMAIWNALICSYTRHNQGHSALKHFQEMQKGTVKPNNAILASVLKACSTIGDTVQGLILYDQVIRSGMDSDAVVGSSAVDMYSNHGAIQEAQKVFDISPKKDVVLWGSLIAGYGQNGYGLSALLVFEKMQKKHVKPSSFIFSSVLKSCTIIRALEEGQLIYDQILKNGLESDVIIGNALVNLYSSCESLEEARNIFDRAVHLDMISWNAMISGYVRQRHVISALELFDQMQRSHWVNPDKVTFSCVLKICGNVGVLGTGKHIHSEVLKNKMESDVVVGTSLIDMYAMCGALDEARKVFDTLENRNWFSWCALIAGYAQHEKWDFAVQCIHEMQCQGFKLDDRIHTIMLASCSQLGELDEGYRYFKSLKEVYGSLPNDEHFNCMIDLFARSGNLSEALEILKTIPSSPDIIGWMSLLTASEKFSHTGMGGDCFNEIVQINPTFPVAYMFMANIYSDSNMSRNLVTCNQ